MTPSQLQADQNSVCRACVGSWTRESAIMTATGLDGAACVGRSNCWNWRGGLNPLRFGWPIITTRCGLGGR